MSGNGSLVGHLGVAALVAMAPFAVIAGTSFAKIAVVLGLVRSALGAPGVPPASVTTALAAVLSLGVMAPVAAGMADRAAALDAAHRPADPLGVGEARAVYDALSPPLLDFLEANTPQDEIAWFRDLVPAGAGRERSLGVLLPAFAISELVEAFLIGFLLLVPFLVVDLVVGNALLAMGLTSMAPAAVALPLKLLLFVAADGWHVLAGGLVVSYA